MTPHTDMSECRRLRSHGSKSFYIASNFLPRALRESASGLYAFCRIADDLVDLGDDPRQALISLHQRLDLIYDARPENHPIDRVLSQIVIDHKLPRGLLDALLEGFEWDTDGRDYRTLAEVCDYGARVAGAVGVMMAILMGVKDHATLARAADLGVAMQLTNIARDVLEDAQMGRRYLPACWVDLPAATIAEAHTTSHQVVSDAIEKLLDLSEDYYRSALLGIQLLPFRARFAITIALRVYRQIGCRLRRRNLQWWRGRVYVNTAEKGLLSIRSLIDLRPKTVPAHRQDLHHHLKGLAGVCSE